MEFENDIDNGNCHEFPGTFGPLFYVGNFLLGEASWVNWYQGTYSVKCGFTFQQAVDFPAWRRPPFHFENSGLSSETRSSSMESPCQQWQGVLLNADKTYLYKLTYHMEMALVTVVASWWGEFVNREAWAETRKLPQEGHQVTARWCHFGFFNHTYFL